MGVMLVTIEVNLILICHVPNGQPETKPDNVHKPKSWFNHNFRIWHQLRFTLVLLLLLLLLLFFFTFLLSFGWFTALFSLCDNVSLARLLSL